LKVYETSKFRKQRKKLQSALERDALKDAVRAVVDKPPAGKKLKGELSDFRRHRYLVDGQERRLIYMLEKGTIYFLSFGLRQGVYK
jgi:mRNA-degrading endonuclease RelE of RelBE toxin-antitoxin system